MNSLFKYRKIDNYTLTSILNDEIYFSDPSKFNDPFDSQFNLRLPKSFYENPIDFADQTILNEREKDRKAGNTEAKRYRAKIRIILENEGIESLKEYFSSLLIATYKKYLITPGISCLSEVNDSILMWSHYSDNHKGLCIEYDAQIMPFKKFEAVKYRDDYHYLTDLRFFTKRTATDPIDRVPFLQKSSYWKYEKEVRIFNLNGPGLSNYHKKALKGIYFGCRAKRSDIEIIKAIIDTRKIKPAIYQAKQSADEYKIMFEKIS